MNRVENIGLYEAVSFVALTVIYKVFFTGISQLCNIAGTASWYLTLISAAVSLFFFYLVYILMKRFPGENLFEVIESVFGKYISKLPQFVFILYSIFYTSSALREFVAMIKVYNLPHTPISVILGSFLLLTRIFDS